MSVKTWVAVYDVASRYAGVERPVSLGWASSSDDKTIRLRLIHDRGSSAEACQSPTPWHVAEGASRLGRPLASPAINQQGRERDLACRRQAITEKRPQLLGRDTLFPANRWRFAGGAGDAIRYSNDRSCHDKGQRAGAVDHDGVSNTNHYLINDRGRLPSRHCSPKFLGA
jgi:hypothetical protein